ncbi:MAG: glucosyl transferase, partial [Ignavibacteriaceae bacterium]|nr:glucosyl transferase [Ignavibacteriaceae bacterium]
SLLYIDSLLPNKNYQYQVSSIENPATSNELSVTTLDTTSHNFSFESFVFGGQYQSSILYDVALLNNNSIWAVGEIYILDSLGQPIRYNAVHWDGNQWELKRINMESSCNPVTYPPLRAISAFSENNIIVTSGGSIGWFDGETINVDCGVNPLLTGSINKIWGSSSNDLYVVGNDGNIAHYQNGQWSRIESGVSTDLLDICGKGEDIFIGGWRDFQPSVLLKLENGNVQKIIEDEDNLFNYRTDFISGAIYSAWMTEKKLYVLTWYDLYRANINTDGTAEAIWKGPIQNWGMISVRGNNANDIIASGVPGKIWHYNGISWHTYNELIDSRDELRRIEIKGNVCVAVGERYENGIEDKALIHIGKR